MDKIIKLRKTNIIGVECEITDRLNNFSKINKEIGTLYIYPLDNRFVLRGFGATRGCVDTDETGIVKDIRLLDNCYSDTIGIYKSSDKEAIEEVIKEFIGCKIED